MSWVNGSILSGCQNPALFAKHKRLALIRRRHNILLARQRAVERAAMDASIDELDHVLHDE